MATYKAIGTFMDTSLNPNRVQMIQVYFLFTIVANHSLHNDAMIYQMIDSTITFIIINV